MIDLERLLKNQSKESKITRFGLVIAEKSKSEVGQNFRKSDDHEPKLKTKLS